MPTSTNTPDTGFTVVQSKRTRGKNRQPREPSSTSFLGSPAPAAAKDKPSPSKQCQLDRDLADYARSQDLPLHPFLSDTTGFHYPNPHSDPLLYVLTYKTERCSQKPCSRLCEKFHSTKERRRSPLEFSYAEHPCPNVKSGSSCKSWGDPSRCEDGDGCGFSHSLLEQMYHPNLYKTDSCNKFGQRRSGCSWGPLCTHAHGEKDSHRQLEAQQRFGWLLECFTTAVVNGKQSVGVEHLLRWAVLGTALPLQREEEVERTRSVSSLRQHSSPLSESFARNSPVSLRSRSSSSDRLLSSPPSAIISRPSSSSFTYAPISPPPGLDQDRRKTTRSMSSSSPLDTFVFQFGYSPMWMENASASSQWDSVRNSSAATDPWKEEAARLYKRLSCRNCSESMRAAVCVPCGHQVCVRCAKGCDTLGSCTVCRVAEYSLVWIDE